jgi:integrase
VKDQPQASKTELPKCRVARKLPFISTEEEIDPLIAECTGKMAAFQQLLQVTAARGEEAFKLKWTDIDAVSNTI